MSNPKLYIERIKDEASLPYYVHDGDAGMDVCAAADVSLAPGESKLIPTGLILHIPRGYEVQVRPRSGLSLKTRLRLPNSPGTIDSGFKDELHVILFNSSYEDQVDGEVLKCTEKNNRQGNYWVKAGDRIAQLIVAQVAEAIVVEGKPENDQHTAQNRGGGFGHSGV